MRFFDGFAAILKRMGRFRLGSIYGKLDGRRKKFNRNLMLFHYLFLAPVFYTMWWSILLCGWIYYWMFFVIYKAIILIARNRAAPDIMLREEPSNNVELIREDESIVQIEPEILVPKGEADKYIKLKDSGADYKTFDLIGNTNLEMQKHINDCSIGNSVKAEKDVEKDKYIASSGSNIGYFPKAAEALLKNKCQIFINDIRKNEDDKFVVTIAIFS